MNIREHLEAMASYPEDCGCEHCEAARLERSLFAQAKMIQEHAERRLDRIGAHLGFPAALEAEAKKRGRK